MNNLMVLEVGMFLRRAVHHGYLRSAGTRGCHVVSVLAGDRGAVPLVAHMEGVGDHPTSMEFPLCTVCIPHRALLFEPICVRVSLLACNDMEAVDCHVFDRPEMYFTDDEALATRAVLHTNTLVVTTTAPEKASMDANLRILLELVRPTHIAFQPSPTHSYLPSDFISKSKASSVDLSGLGGYITAIPEGFLRESSNLRTLDLSTIFTPKLSSVGSNFLHMCTSLEDVHFTEGCTTVPIRTINNNWLHSCSSLKSINLQPFSRVTTIGSNFMGQCSSLLELDLSPLANTVTTIGTYFASGCTSLRTIDLSPLNKVVNLRTMFLEGCTSLTTIDMSPMVSLPPLGRGQSGLLKRCTGLVNVKLPPTTSFGGVASVGESITPLSLVQMCTSLKHIDLRPLGGREEVGGLFLHRCSSLTTIDLTPLSTTITIGDSFIEGCTLLPSIDLSPLCNVRHIGDGFLAMCDGLTHLDLTPLSTHLISIGRQFLMDCSSLEVVNMEVLQCISSIGPDAMVGCVRLPDIDWSPFYSAIKAGLPLERMYVR